MYRPGFSTGCTLGAPLLLFGRFSPIRRGRGALDLTVRLEGSLAALRYDPAPADRVEYVPRSDRTGSVEQEKDIAHVATRGVTGSTESAAVVRQVMDP